MARFTRLHDWDVRLYELVAEARGWRFAYGRCDCVFFASACVEAVTGVGLTKGLGLRYRTARGALGAMRRYCGADTVEQLATFVLGEPVPPLLAQRGDIVGHPGVDGGLGVCLGGQAVFMRPVSGFGVVPMVEIRLAWAVGR